METKTTGSAAAEPAVAPLVASPFCRDIRSKKYYFLQEMPTEVHHLRDASNHCWCLRTVQAFGPDGELVRPEDCNADRGCYRSLFEEGAS